MSRYPRARRASALLAAPCGALLGLLLLHTFALGHAELASSSPAANSSVPTAPTRLVLTFTESIDPTNSSVILLGPDQAPVLGTGALHPDVRATSVTIDLPALRPGIYTVTYRVTSASDGHVTSGQFAFLLDPTGTQPGPSSAPSSASPSTDPITIAARWATLVLILLLFGTTLFWLFSARPAIAASSSPADVADLLAGAGLWAPLGLLALAAFIALSIFLTLAAGAIAPGAQTHPGHSGLPLDFAAPFGWTPFAIAMRVALLGIGGAFVVAAGRYVAIEAARRRGGGASRERLTDTALLVAVVAAAAAALAGMSLGGHAAAGGGLFFAALDWAHLLAVASWLGTLGGLALLAWRIRRNLLTRRPLLQAALVRHSRLALVAAPVVVLTGLANSPIVIGQPRGLIGSEYGDLILAKATLFSAAVAIGAVNFLLVGRRSTARVSMLVASEALVGLAAVAVAATMLSIQPAASRVPTLSSGANQTAHLYGNAGSSNVHAAISIPAPGEQLYQVAVSDPATGAPRADVQAVVLEFKPPTGTSGAIERVGLARTADTEIWSIRGAFTPNVGEWTVSVVVQRPRGLESIAFPLAVDRPIPPQLVPPPNSGVGVPVVLAILWLLPAGIVGWLLVCLPLVAVAAIAVLERMRRRDEGPPSRWMAIARLGLVVVVVVAALGIGSRALVEAANRGATSGPNPVPASPGSVQRGRLIFLANCASCHGADGSGHGPPAAGMLPAPGDIGPGVSSMSDEELQFLVTNGLAATKMPSFATTLSENERWDLVNYLHSQWPNGR